MRVKTAPAQAGVEVTALGFDGAVVRVTPEKGTTDATGCLDVTLECGGVKAGCPGSTTVTFDSPALTPCSVAVSCTDFARAVTAQAPPGIAALTDALWGLTTGVIELLDETLDERAEARAALQALWDRSRPAQRKAVVDAVVRRLEHELAGLLVFPPTATAPATPLSFRVDVVGHAAGVRRDLDATGICATWSDPRWGRMELGLGVPAPVGSVYRRRLPRGGVIWLGFARVTPPIPLEPTVATEPASRPQRNARLERALVPLAATLGSRLFRLLDEIATAAEEFGSAIESAWASTTVSGRRKLYEQLSEALDSSLAAVSLQEWLALRAARLGSDRTVFHSDAKLKPGKEDVGAGKTAYGGKVVVNGDTPAVEVGVGVVPKLPPAGEVIRDPVGTIVNTDRAEGIGAWVKFNY